MNRIHRRPIVAAFAALAAMPSIAAAQALRECATGQSVIDRSGVVAAVVAGRDGMCLLKSKDGKTQRWVAITELSAALTRPPAPAASQSAAAPGLRVVPDGVNIVRPALDNRVAYRADALGHVVLSAKVNGAPVRFLVDTGATLVSLTPEDANAAGLKRGDLNFDHVVHTANGPVKAAFVQLREIRIEDRQTENVQAAVIESLKQSVLGMSFLNRLKGFELHDGVLTMNW